MTRDATITRRRVLRTTLGGTAAVLALERPRPAIEARLTILPRRRRFITGTTA